MGAMASQINSLTIVYSTVYSGADQRKHQSSASLAFVRGIHRWPVNSPHKWPVTRKIFPFDDVIMLMLYFIKNNFYIDNNIPAMLVMVAAGSYFKLAVVQTKHCLSQRKHVLHHNHIPYLYSWRAAIKSLKTKLTYAWVDRVNRHHWFS